MSDYPVSASQAPPVLCCREPVSPPQSGLLSCIDLGPILYVVSRSCPMGGAWTVLSPLTVRVSCCSRWLSGGPLELAELPALPGASGEAPEHPALLPTQLRGRPVQARPVRCSPFAEGIASSCSSVPALFCEL